MWTVVAPKKENKGSCSRTVMCHDSLNGHSTTHFICFSHEWQYLHFICFSSFVILTPIQRPEWLVESMLPPLEPQTERVSSLTKMTDQMDAP
jgi:hypothetical protein